MTRVRADHCTQRLVLGTAIRRRHRTMSAVGHPMAGPNDGTKNRPLRTCDGDIHGGPLTVDPQRRWPRGARRRSADFHRIEPPKLFNSSSENGSPHPRYARHALILSPDRPSRHTGSSRRKGAYILAFGFGCGAGIPVFALGSITNNAGCCVDLRRLGAPEIGYSSRKAGGANGAPQQGPTGERCKDGFGVCQTFDQASRRRTASRIVASRCRRPLWETRACHARPYHVEWGNGLSPGPLGERSVRPHGLLSGGN